MAQYLPLRYWWRMSVASSRSGRRGHHHVTIRTAAALSDTQRVLLAILLGSDPVREIINYVRVSECRPFPICFLRLKNVRRPADKWRRIREIPL